MKLGISLSVQCWLQDLKELVNAGWLLSMLASLVSTLYSILHFMILQYLMVLTHTRSCAETVPIRTVNRQCSSGLQAVADVAASIRAGFYDIGECV